MIGDKILYQVGDGLGDHYVFDKQNLGYSYAISYKQIRETGSNFDGDVRVNGTNPDFKNQYELSISFRHNNESRFDVDVLTKIFKPKPFKIFFYSKDKSGFIDKFYFNWAYCTSNINNNIQAQEVTGQGEKDFSVTLQMTPYFFECDEELRYFDRNGYDDNQLYWSSTKIPSINNAWGSATPVRPAWGLTFLNSWKLMSTLTDTQELATIDTPNIGTSITFKDRFFARELLSLSALTTNTFTTTTTVAQRFVSTTFNTATSADNRVLLIRLDNWYQFKQITLRNIFNSTGLEFTWNAFTQNTPIIYNTSLGEAFFDNGDSVPIDWLTVRPVDDGWLSFDGTKNFNIYRPSTVQQLQIDQTIITGTTNISINLLRTYN